MLYYRLRHQQRQPGAEPLPPEQQVKQSLQQLEQQTWLLSRVHLWALLPMFFPMVAFVIQVSLRDRLGGWWSILPAAITIPIIVAALVSLYRLNQDAIRKDLEPKRQQLLAILQALSSKTDLQPK